MAVRRAGPRRVQRPVHALVRGDARGFEEVYCRHAPAVHRAAMQILADPMRAQDVVQEVFMRLWRHPDRFDADRGSLGNYLRLMARSQALDIRREANVARRARERLVLLSGGDQDRPDDRPPLAVELRGDRTIVLHALTRLPAPQREAIVMTYWGGLTADQIAARFGLPVGTVKSRIRLGLGKLRQRCGGQLDAEQPLAA